MAAASDSMVKYPSEQEIKEQLRSVLKALITKEPAFALILHLNPKPLKLVVKKSMQSR